MSSRTIHYGTQALAVRAAKAFAQREEGTVVIRCNGDTLEITPPELVLPLVSITVAITTLLSGIAIAAKERLVQRDPR